VRAFEAGAATSEPWGNPHTVAFGITVPKALGDFLVLDALYATEGTAVAVSDGALLADQRLCAELEGLFICPEGAAAISAVRLLRDAGWLGRDDVTVVLNTGSGLKNPVLSPSMLPSWSPVSSSRPRRRPYALRRSRSPIARPTGGNKCVLC